RREVLLTGRLDAEPEDTEQQQASEEPDRPVQDRGPRLRRPAEPVQSLPDAAASAGRRLGGGLVRIDVTVGRERVPFVVLVEVAPSRAVVVNLDRRQDRRTLPTPD